MDQQCAAQKNNTCYVQVDPYAYRPETVPVSLALKIAGVFILFVISGFLFLFRADWLDIFLVAGLEAGFMFYCNKSGVSQKYAVVGVIGIPSTLVIWKFPNEGGNYAVAIPAICCFFLIIQWWMESRSEERKRKREEEKEIAREKRDMDHQRHLMELQMESERKEREHLSQMAREQHQHEFKLECMKEQMDLFKKMKVMPSGKQLSGLLAIEPSRYSLA